MESIIYVGMDVHKGFVINPQYKTKGPYIPFPNSLHPFYNPSLHFFYIFFSVSFPKIAHLGNNYNGVSIFPKEKTCQIVTFSNQ